VWREQGRFSLLLRFTYSIPPLFSVGFAIQRTSQFPVAASSTVMILIKVLRSARLQVIKDVYETVKTISLIEGALVPFGCENKMGAVF